MNDKKKESSVAKQKSFVQDNVLLQIKLKSSAIMIEQSNEEIRCLL